MHERELLPRRRLRLDDLNCLPRRSAVGAREGQALSNEAVFFSGKDVRSDIDLIPGRVDDDHTELSEITE
jgi:hypothetical protein